MPEPFKTLAEMAAYIQKQYIANAMKNEVATVVKETEKDSIEAVAYFYTPKDYQRRYENGGLESMDNMESVVSPDGTTLSVTNITHGYNDSNVNVAGLVEYGQQNTQGYGYYDWHPPNDREPLYLEPRQYMEETARRLEVDGLAREALKKGLERQNLNVK